MTIKNNLSGSVKTVIGVDVNLKTAATIETTTNVDCRGFRWAYVILQVNDNAGTTASTLTISSSATSGGTYTLIEDDNFNMTDGASANVTAVTTVGITTDGTFISEIDLDQFDNFLKFDWSQSPAGAGTADVGCMVVLSGARNGKNDVPAASTLEYQILTADKAAW